MAIDWDEAVLGPLLEVFGEPVVYVPATGSPYAASGVFDEGYANIGGDPDNGPLTDVQPRLGIRLSAFAAEPVRGDRLILSRLGKTFQVRDIHLDGQGGAKLELNLAKPLSIVL